jgi:DNA ligase (NAD+)
MRAGQEEIAGIYGVGPVIAAEITRFFADPRNQRVVERLLSSGVRGEAVAAASSKELEGTTFVFTGTMVRLSRERAEAEVKKRGGKTVNSVSSKTTYVVAGEKAGSKLAKAEKLGVEVIDEDAFLRMIGEER